MGEGIRVQGRLRAGDYAESEKGLGGKGHICVWRAHSACVEYLNTKVPGWKRQPGWTLWHRVVGEYLTAGSIWGRGVSDGGEYLGQRSI